MRKEKKQRNYYQEINNALKNYEEYKPWHNKSIDWICNRIDWCWKFRHITKEQMEELTDRCCKVLWRDAGNVRNRKINLDGKI